MQLIAKVRATVPDPDTAQGPCTGQHLPFYKHSFALFDHSNCTVCGPTFLVFHAQMSPISPFVSSYQPVPGMGSVIASHSSWELVDVRASSVDKFPTHPLHPG